MTADDWLLFGIPPQVQHVVGGVLYVMNVTTRQIDDQLIVTVEYKGTRELGSVHLNAQVVEAEIERLSRAVIQKVTRKRGRLEKILNRS